MEGELPKQNLLQDNPQKKFSTGLLIIMNQKRFRLKNHNEKSEKIVSNIAFSQISKNLGKFFQVCSGDCMTYLYYVIT